MVLIDNAGASSKLSIVSELFLSLLSGQERTRFEWRPIEHNLRAREYDEVVHRHPPVPSVSASRHDTYYGRCESCGFEWVIPNYVPGLPDSYVAERDPRRPGPHPSRSARGRTPISR